MGAQNSAAMEFCRKQIEGADLFVGLIGFRRGWEPSGDPTNRSITEMEHDWAQAASRPRYIHVAPDTFAAPNSLREPDAKHERQMTFRERIMANGDIIVSQNGFESPELLAAEVVQRLLSEQLLTLLDKQGDLKRAEQGGLDRDIVLKLAKKIRSDEALDFDGAVAELENAITIALGVIARGQRGSNEDGFVDEVLKNVATHTKKGQTERAVKALEDALIELKARESDQQEAFKRSRLTLLQAALEQDILRRDAASAARRVEQCVAIEHPEDLDSRFDALRKRQDAFDVEGREKGINFSLEVAIEVARLAVAAARNAGYRAHALNDLGIALKNLGDRESGTARLDEAVTAYREALKERPRDVVPLQWAITQNNLANALGIIGARESGTTRLDEAVTAYRDVLTELTNEIAPLEWAGTQNNLGNALKALGDRESGTARLEEAAIAYGQALVEYTRDRVPLQWAMTQNNLGNTLRALGEREGGTARFYEAITAYHEALKERTRERVPLQWAATRNNLGVALAAIGARERSTKRLQEAVDTFREALKEYTRERVPLQWAMTQNNLGNTLRVLGEIEGRISSLDEAITAYREALNIFEAANATYYVSGTLENLMLAESSINKLGKP
jgi:tetratricopeptide (TPR) repeat protein